MTRDPISNFNEYDRECADDEKLFPHCSLCGAAITGDFYKHVYIHGLDYIICDDCLEEDSVDSYVDARRFGY